MKITWISQKGGREINEDSVGKSRKKGIVCVVVADGLGGHSGGQIASDLAVKTIIEAFEKNPGFSKEHVKEYITRANEEIVARAMNDPEHLYMSSTVAVLLKKGRRVLWANAGDSRIYKFCDGMITDVSEDHSVAFLEFVNGGIEYSDIRQHRDRNKLTSALGVAMDGMNISEMSHVNMSTCFMLCTDGWWEYVTEDEAEKTLRESREAEAWLKNMLEIRQEKAPSDSDNFTAAIVMI